MILIFTVSLNENMKLALKIQEQLNSFGKESEIINLVNLDLPMYDSNKEEKDGIPSQINVLVQKMESSEGYVVVSPEYNASIPPVLANFITWVSRTSDDFRKLFTLKIIQLATHSGSGGANVSNVMRSQFTMLGSILMPRDIIATYKAPIKEDSLNKIISQFTKFIK